MLISATDFIIISLAAYRLTHLLVFDKITEPVRSLFVTRDFHGPLKTFTLHGGPLRRFIGKALICHWCTGIWASAALVAGVWMAYGVVMWVCLALAAAAFLSLIETAWMKFVGYPELVEKVESEPDDSNEVERLKKALEVYGNEQSTEKGSENRPVFSGRTLGDHLRR